MSVILESIVAETQAALARAQLAAGQTIAIRDAYKAKIEANRQWERRHPWRHQGNLLLGRTRDCRLTQAEMDAVIANAKPLT